LEKKALAFILGSETSQFQTVKIKPKRSRSNTWALLICLTERYAKTSEPDKVKVPRFLIYKNINFAFRDLEQKNYFYNYEKKFFSKAVFISHVVCADRCKRTSNNRQ